MRFALVLGCILFLTGCVGKAKYDVALDEIAELKGQIAQHCRELTRTPECVAETMDIRRVHRQATEPVR